MTFAQKLFRSGLRKKGKNNQIVLNCLMLGLFLLMTVVYLFQVNAGVSQCLEIEDIEQRLKSLKIENEDLLKETAGLGSMANIAQVVKGLKMVKVDQADYLVVTEEILAEK